MDRAIEDRSFLAEGFELEAMGIHEYIVAILVPDMYVKGRIFKTSQVFEKSKNVISSKRSWILISWSLDATCFKVAQVS